MKRWILCASCLLCVVAFAPRCTPPGPGKEPAERPVDGGTPPPDASPVDTASQEPTGREAPRERQIQTDMPQRETSGDGASCSNDPSRWPKAIPSRQKVTLTLENKTQGTLYVAHQGMGCRGYRFGAQRAAEFSCPCECPRPPDPHVSTYKILKPGEAVTFTWDAREPKRYTYNVDCEAQGWPGMGCGTETRSVSQPVKPGDYGFAVGLAVQQPERCHDDGQGSLHCNPPTPNGNFPSPVALCDTPKRFTFSITLPASGDVTLTRPITDKDLKDQAP